MQEKNNRIIKFRAWDSNKDRMIVGNIISVNEDGVIIYDREYATWRNSSYIPLQFTGLKDKNGVDIFEGDLIEYRENWLESESGLDERFVHEVKWSGTGWIINNHGSNKKVKVIGNIYENPELCKK